MFSNRGGRENDKHLTGSFVATNHWLPLLVGDRQRTLYDALSYGLLHICDKAFGAFVFNVCDTTKIR